MAKVLSSISGNLISAASAGYAPTNGADVSAIASAYQVVSATGTQLYAGTAYVTSINSDPVSAERAGNAANAALANSAWYDGTGRFISALPDSAAVSAIASSYASGKQDSSAMSAYALSSDVSGVIDTVSGNSASWGGGATGDYVEKSAIAVNIGSSNSVNRSAFARGYSNTADFWSLADGLGNSATGYSITQGSYNKAGSWACSLGTYNSASINGLSQGSYNRAKSDSFAQGENNTADTNSFAQGQTNSASGMSFAQGAGNTAAKYSVAIGRLNSAINTAVVVGEYNLKGNGSTDNVAFTIGNGTGIDARHDLLNITKNGEITVYSSTADATGTGVMSSIRALSADVSGVIDTVSGNSAAWGETAYIPLSSTSIEMTSTAYSASYNLESIDLFVKDANSSNVVIAPDGISFKSGNSTNIGFVDPYHIGNWDGVYNTVLNNSGSWTGGGGGGITLRTATAYKQNGTQLVKFTGVASADSKPLIAQTIQAGAVQSIGTSNFFYGPSRQPFTANTAGIYAPLQFATGACLAMDGGTYRSYYKGNEWFISDYGKNRSGAVRAEVHNTRGIHISGSNTVGVGFDLLTTGLNFTDNTGTTSMTPANIAEWNSCRSSVNSNSSIWNSASAVSSCATTAYVESGLSGKQDVFSAGDGLEFVQSGSDTVLQVEAPVDIVAGPGIAIDNPDGNTLRVSQAYPTDETVLFSGSSVAANFILSEAPSNFAYIRVEFRRSSSLLGFVSSVTLPVNSSSVSFPLMLVYGNVDNSTNYNEFIVRYNGNTTQTTFTFQYALKRTSIVGGSVTISTDTAPTLEVFKVVGVHRIAGGN